MAFLLLLGLYVGSYVVLSRQGFAEARKYHATVFMYGGWDPPFGDAGFGFHGTCLIVYAPLNAVDVWLGWGMTPNLCFPPTTLVK